MSIQTRRHIVYNPMHQLHAGGVNDERHDNNDSAVLEIHTRSAQCVCTVCVCMRLHVRTYLYTCCQCSSSRSSCSRRRPTGVYVFARSWDWKFAPAKLSAVHTETDPFHPHPRGQYAHSNEEYGTRYFRPTSARCILAGSAIVCSMYVMHHCICIAQCPDVFVCSLRVCAFSC